MFLLPFPGSEIEWQHFLQSVITWIPKHMAGPGDLAASERCKISWFSFQAERDEGEQLFVMENWLFCGKEEILNQSEPWIILRR